MQTLALSTSWNSSKHQDGEAMLLEIRDLGFKRVELGHGIRFSLWPGVLKAVEAGEVEIGSLHNFCPVPMGILRPSPDCYLFTDPRPAIRRTAIESTFETIEQASKLGAKAVVLHLGWGGPNRLSERLETAFRHGHHLDRSYVQAKINAVRYRKEHDSVLKERVRSCLDPIIEAATKVNVRLGFECRAEFEEYPNEVEMAELLDIYPQETVGYWHDFGHAARKDFLGWHDHAETLRARSSRLIGCHLHDCLPPHRDHQPLGCGDIDLPLLLPIIPATAIAVLELSPRATPEQVIASRNLWNLHAGNSSLS